MLRHYRLVAPLVATVFGQQLANAQNPKAAQASRFDSIPDLDFGDTEKPARRPKHPVEPDPESQFPKTLSEGPSNQRSLIETKTVLGRPSPGAPAGPGRGPGILRQRD